MDRAFDISQLPKADYEYMRNTVEDHIEPVGLWPLHIAKMFLSKHLNFLERYQLTLFLLANKYPPILIVEWYERRKMLRDYSARLHVAEIIKLHKTGALEAQRRTAHIIDANKENYPFQNIKLYWDNLGQIEDEKSKNRVIQTPNFAYDEVHSLHWDTAIYSLKTK